MITFAETDAIKVQVKAHFGHVWPLIEAGREDPGALDVANAYLGEVQAHSEIEYRVVIKMIERASGLSWDAIVGGEPARLIVARA